MPAKNINKSVEKFVLYLLKEGYSVFVEAQGSSMHPFIKQGDSLKIAPLNRKINIGDIVAVYQVRDGKLHLYVHRVVKIGHKNARTLYITKGDAHRMVIEQPVTADSIVGRVVEIKRKNININLTHPLWRVFHNLVARLSLIYPRFLIFSARYIDLIIEWRLFLFKIRRRIRKIDPLRYNTEEFFLGCVKSAVSDRPFTTGLLDLVQEGINWNYFIRLAINSGVNVLIYENLKKISKTIEFPLFVSTRLKYSYFFATLKATYHHNKLKDLLTLFYKNNIVAVPLKGTFLSNRLYSDVTARGLSGDIDLLIDRKDVEVANRLLLESGFRRRTPENRKRWKSSCSYIKQYMPVVDLHWDIITMFGRCEDGVRSLRASVEEVKDDDIHYFDFKEEELLLYLSAHIVCSDCFGHLRYLCDIYKYLEKNKGFINWDSIIRKAYTLKLSSSLYTTLLITKHILDADVPLYVLQRLRPNLCKRILIRFFANKKVVLRTDLLRRRLLNSFFMFIFYGMIETRSIKECFFVFFPPRNLIQSKNYCARIIKGICGLLKVLLNIGK